MPVQSASSPSRSSQEEQTSEVKPAEALKLLFERCMALLDPSQQAFCQVNLNLKLQQSCCYFLKVAATKGFKIVCGKKDQRPRGPGIRTSTVNGTTFT